MAKWEEELPEDLQILLEEPKDFCVEVITIQEAIDQAEWIMEQVDLPTFYGSPEDDPGVAEVQAWLKKYKRYKK